MDPRVPAWIFQCGLFYFNVDPGSLVLIEVCQYGSWVSFLNPRIPVCILGFQCES